MQSVGIRGGERRGTRVRVGWGGVGRSSAIGDMLFEESASTSEGPGDPSSMSFKHSSTAEQGLGGWSPSLAGLFLGGETGHPDVNIDVSLSPHHLSKQPVFPPTQSPSHPVRPFRAHAAACARRVCLFFAKFVFTHVQFFIPRSRH